MEEDGHDGGGASAGKKILQLERILPRRSLRVLLVECDDSTRHILAVLLKKCGYLVAAAADGVKAWEVMKEKNHNFDLVLAEVDMPSQSGILLLTKIVATEKCRSIPVIMTSSHDSMGLVHKCMLKGAADYLLKPVRKNELSNVWQHVWRRHCSSGGKPDNGTESPSKTIKPHLAKQGSSPKDTKAQEKQPVNGTTVIRNGLETNPRKEQGTSVAIGGETIFPVQNSSLGETEHKRYRTDSSTNKTDFEGTLHMITKGGGNNCGLHEPNNKPLQGKLNFVKPVSYGQSSFLLTEQNAPSNKVLGVAKDASHAKNGLTNPQPEMDFSVRNPMTKGCVSQQVKEKHILIHSSGSAFSRYCDKKISFASRTVITSELCTKQKESGDKYQLRNIYEGDGTHTSFTTRGVLPVTQKNEGEDIPCPRSDKTMENDQQSYDARRQDGHCGPSSSGDTTHCQQPQVGLVSVPIPVRMMPHQSLCANYNATLKPIYNPQPCLTPLGSDSASTAKRQTSNDQLGCLVIQQNASAESFSIHPHKDGSHPSHFKQDAETGPPSGLRGFSLEPTSRTDSSNEEFVNGVGSIGSGETTDADGNTGAALETGNESGVHKCNKRPTDSDRAHREAALMKFHLKRKERCFEKRVRYHSRRKLAELRPRVKGQFVRQKIVDMKLASESTA